MLSATRETASQYRSELGQALTGGLRDDAAGAVPLFSSSGPDQVVVPHVLNAPTMWGYEVTTLVLAIAYALATDSGPSSPPRQS